MKKLLMLLIVFTFTTTLVSCNKDKKNYVSGSGGGSSSSGIGGGFQPVPTNTNNLTFYYTGTMNSFSNQYLNDPYWNTNTYYRGMDGRIDDNQVSQYLNDIVAQATETHNCFPDNFLVNPNQNGSSSYFQQVFGVAYNEILCTKYRLGDEVFYVDLNFPLIANPVAYYRVTEDEWWIFQTQSIEYFKLHDFQSN